MEKKDYINAQDLANLLGISVSRAYRVIRQLNDELKEKGYLVIAGRVPAKYFENVGSMKIKIEINESEGFY